MKKLPLILAFLSTISCFAQNEIQVIPDSLTINKKAITIENKLNTSIPTQQNVASTLNMNSFYHRRLTDFLQQPPTIKIPPTNVLPSTNLTDNLYNRFDVNDVSWINTSRTSSSYYGVGGVYTVDANFNHEIGNFGVLTAGVYASKFNVYKSYYNNAGVNGNFKIKISDRLSMNLFGQYTPLEKTSEMQMMTSMYPQSYYGGSIEFKVTDKWGIITGATREFDVFSRKWVTNPFIMPVFYKH
jgi:hypothetical protein